MITPVLVMLLMATGDGVKVDGSVFLDISIQLLLPFALGFGVVVVAMLVAGRLADREGTAAADDPAVPKTWRRIAVVVAVLVIAAGTAATVQTVRIGHSGSTAVWDGVATTSA